MIEYKAMVTVNEGEESGLDEYSLEGLSKNGVYQTLAITLKVSDDGSNTLCFVLKDDNSVIVRKATSLFIVIGEQETKE